MTPVRVAFRLCSGLICLLLPCWVGCCWHRAAVDPRPASCCPTAPREWALKPVAERLPITFAELPDLQGLPLTVEESTSVRSMTLAEVRHLAAAESPSAQALRNHRSRLECRPEGAPPCLLLALDAQADQEELQANGQATEAYFNLVEIYLQHELLFEGRSDIDRLERIFQKLQENDLAKSMDPLTPERQRLELESQFAELATRYQQLTTGLEIQLNLRMDAAQPIWPEVTPEGGAANLPTREQAVAAGLANRRDLQALQYLLECSSCLSPAEILGLGSAAQPFLGLGKRVQGRILARATDPDSTGQHSAARDQLCQWIAAKQKQIQLEVNQAFAEFWNSRQQVDLRLAYLASLSNSLQRQEQLREIEMVDVQNRLDLERQQRQARAELVTDLVNRERAYWKLQLACGQGK